MAFSNALKERNSKIRIIYKLFKLCAQLHGISAKGEHKMISSGMNTHLVHPQLDECSSKPNVFPPKRPGAVILKNAPAFSVISENYYYFFLWPCHRPEGLRLRNWPRCLNARYLYFVRQVRVSVIGMLTTYKYFLPWNFSYTQDIFFASLWSLMPSCTFPACPDRFFLCILAGPFDSSDHECGIYYGQ